MENGNFKVIMTDGENTVTIDLGHNDVTTNEVMKAVAGCMLALTWRQEQLTRMCKDYFEECDEYEKV